ncbi:hypothetical protein Tco_0471671 [Tanacetum coccineum]
MKSRALALRLSSWTPCLIAWMLASQHTLEVVLYPDTTLNRVVSIDALHRHCSSTLFTGTVHRDCSPEFLFLFFGLMFMASSGSDRDAKDALSKLLQMGSSGNFWTENDSSRDSAVLTEDSVTNNYLRSHEQPLEYLEAIDAWKKISKGCTSNPNLVPELGTKTITNTDLTVGQQINVVVFEQRYFFEDGVPYRKEHVIENNSPYMDLMIRYNTSCHPEKNLQPT